MGIASTTRANELRGWRVPCAVGAIVLGLLLASGCAPRGPAAGPASRGTPATVAASAPAPAPIGVQMRDVEPELRDQRFSVLLGFEESSDGVFALTEPTRAMLTAERAHTGQFGARLPAGTRRLVIDLPSLLRGRRFPDEWTLLGAYLYTEEPLSVRIGYERNGQRLAERRQVLEARRWQMVRMAVAHLPTDGSAQGLLTLEFDQAATAPVWCDDVLLLDNRRTLVSQGGWTVRQDGFSWVMEAPPRFKLLVKTPEASGSAGWTLEEANSVRVRLSAQNRTRHWTIYADGRQYIDGQYDGSLVRIDPYKDAYEQEHLSPAELIVPEGMGRVNRNTPGDVRNTGYNPLRGAYQLIAGGPRMQVTLRPRGGTALVRPVLEIEQLPPGKVLITLEGQLIQTVTRLPDGQLLVAIPLRIERTATVDLRVQ